jgi:hypothetical protein
VINIVVKLSKVFQRAWVPIIFKMVLYIKVILKMVLKTAMERDSILTLHILKEILQMVLFMVRQKESIKVREFTMAIGNMINFKAKADLNTLMAQSTLVNSEKGSWMGVDNLHFHVVMFILDNLSKAKKVGLER